MTKIFNYYKKYGYETEVMGASFRKAEQIIELAGCDLLTIAPELLVELDGMDGTLVKKLDVQAAKAMSISREDMQEKNYRWHHNADAMATEKLAGGIQSFHADALKLNTLVSEHMDAKG